MKIEQVDIRSFGLFRNYHETFSDGLNIIEGGNETGKSTLAAFTRYMLFGFPDDHGVLSERERRLNWVTGNADGSMTLVSGDTRYRIDRRTERVGNGYIDTCTLFDLSTETEVPLTMSPGETLLGVGSDLFESTAFLGQLADAGDTSGEMRTAIENLMFSGDEKINTAGAITRLTEARDALLSPDGKEGKIVEVRGRTDSLAARLTAAVKGQRDLIALNERYEAELARRDESEKQHKMMQELKICYGNHQILTSFEQLHAMETQSSDVAAEADNHRRDNTYGTFFPTEEYAADITVKRRLFSDARRAYEAAETTLSELESKQVAGRDIQKNLQRVEKYGGEVQVLARHAALRKNYLAFVGIAALCVVLFLIATAGGIVRAYFTGADGLATFAFVSAAITFIGGFTTIMLALNRHEKARAYCLDYGAKNGKELRLRMDMVKACREETAAHMEELRIARDRAEHARTAYFSARAVLDEALSVWGKSLPRDGGADDFLNIFEGSIRDVLNTYRALSERKAALDSAITVLATSLSGLDEDEIRALVPESRRAALADTTPAQIEEGIRYYEGQAQFFRNSTADLKNALDAMRAATEEPALISEHLSHATHEMDLLRDRYRAIDAALASLTGADIRLRAELSPRLARYARDLMDVMTDGKYTGVEVGDNLQLDVLHDGTAHSAEVLSGGTRDIAYITLRLALVHLLYHETPPLLFDESFAHQDNDRSYSMLKVFMALAERNHTQTFVFTCRSREYTIANEIGGNCRRIQLI